MSPLDMETTPAQKPRTRRGAVSGSVMTEEQATSYVKKVTMVDVRMVGGAFKLMTS